MIKVEHTANGESPYMRRSDIRVDIPLMNEEEEDKVFYDMMSHASPSTSTASSSPKTSLEVSFEDVPESITMDVEEDQLFAAYAAEVVAPSPDLSDAWDAYDPSPVLSLTSMSPSLKQSATSGRHGVKRPLERTHSPSKAIPMRTSTVDPCPRTTTRRTTKKVSSPSSPPVSTPVDVENAKKIKVSRERQLKINAASRRCRKKQKLELQFLRTHVVELQQVLEEQVGVLRTLTDQTSQRTKLSMILHESRRQVDVMGSSGRSSTCSTNSIKLEEEGSNSTMSTERRQSLLHIASFMRNTMALESLTFTPEVIACLPIQMDGWHLRLAITEKNYTIHNTKFFPCRVSDLYAFGWETLITSGTITGMMGNPSDEYSVVTPLDKDVAHVYSKTVGKWSLSVHGVANVSYSSLVSRSFNNETQRGMICQQSVLEDKDFQDETTIPWLCKRWVVFQSTTVDGVEGTQVEAYRTASYATGRRIYKEDKTYDSFCEHLIRRYAESNALLERMMARDKRFQQMHPNGIVEETLAEPVTSADRVVKSLLLF